MRLSCNGCRVLRKGCSDACTIRPCLQWINSPDAQANATVFLAKFYGRAGLLNLIAAAPTDALRPAVFRSLLYEACGRVVNPVYGAVGLLWSGTWHMCQAAVEAVLKGAPIVVQVEATAAAAAAAAAYDIRHVFPKSASSSNNKHSPAAPVGGAPQPPVVADDQAAQSKDKHTPTDRRLKAAVAKPKFKRAPSPFNNTKQATSTTTQNKSNRKSQNDHPSSDDDDDDCDRHSASASLDTHEAASHVSQGQAEQDDQRQAEAAEQRTPPSMGLLDLTLGLLITSSAPPAGCTQGGGGGGSVDEPAAGVIGFRFL